nr:unnamed protein product [Callosobruchus analis]
MQLQPNRTSSFYVNRSNNVLKCILCNGTHLLYKCPAFLGKTPQERYNFAKSKNLCLNCLSTIHRSQQCKSSKKCLTCNRFHHTLLHLGTTPGTTHDTLASAASSSIAQTDVSANVNSSPSQEILSASSLVSTHATVLLSTAIVDVVDNKGCYQPLRCLVDSGSMTSFITQRAVSKLGIRKCPANIEIKGLGCTNVLETTQVWQYAARAASEVNGKIQLQIDADFKDEDKNVHKSWKKF